MAANFDIFLPKKKSKKKNSKSGNQFRRMSLWEGTHMYGVRRKCTEMLYEL